MNWRTLFSLRCPVCGKGKIFHGYLDTPERCPDCGFYFMRETGYFLPHSAISYVLVLAAAAVVWLVLHFVVRMQTDYLMLTLIIVLSVLFGAWSNRHAKMIWMMFDLWIHPPTREDFESRGRT